MVSGCRGATMCRSAPTAEQPRSRLGGNVVAHGGRVCGSAPTGHTQPAAGSLQDVLPAVTDQQLAAVAFTVDLGAAVLV
jgi:hypothetical protein